MTRAQCRNRSSVPALLRTHTSAGECGSKPTLAKPTLAKVKVLVVCEDFGFWEGFVKLIVQVFFCVCVSRCRGGLLEAPGEPNVHVWSSRVVVCNPGGPEAAGASHDNPRTPNVHI